MLVASIATQPELVSRLCRDNLTAFIPRGDTFPSLLNGQSFLMRYQSVAVPYSRNFFVNHFAARRTNSIVHRLRNPSSRIMSSAVQPLYHCAHLDDVEDPEHYRPGDFHPVSIGDVFSRGRYRVLHKLGFGGSSTVWLARDQKKQFESEESESLVSLKVLSAVASSKQPTEIPELHIPQELSKTLRDVDHPGRRHLQIIEDHFLVEGPNGSHLCMTYPFAGPSILSMSETIDRTSGSRGLRGDLARKVAKQLAETVELLHSAGVVHGDLTSSNILFRLSSEVLKWNDDEVYQMLGNPQTESVITRDGSPPSPAAPSDLVAPIDVSSLCNPQFLEEDVVLIDYGQSYFTDRVPKDYTPATPYHYLSPEAYFDSKLTFASDVWALACVIYEIRAGFALFEPFLASTHTVLKQMVEMLGRFPDPWWSSWDQRLKWFEESGEPKSEAEQQKAGVFVQAEKTSIRRKLCSIGIPDEAYDEVTTGTPLEKEEADLLADLLEKMLNYLPEDRITMKEVVQHPWFKYQ
ncbi:hypothetical protein ACEPAF_5489 [Sanghuangporus sanghuang]